MEEKRFLEHTEHGRTNKFEIINVNLWSATHEIWNIGREHFPFEGYIPLCYCDADFHVDLSNLKCVKVDSEEMALAAIHAAHYCMKANHEWFEEFRKRFLMDFEQKCKFLVGKRIDYVTINKVDKLAKRESRGYFHIISHGAIFDTNANFWVKPKGYHSEICFSFNTDFINRLVLDGISDEVFCGGYYRNYFLK